MEQSKNTTQPTPESIMQIGMGFWASKTLLTAVKFELFTHLANNKQMSAKEIKALLGFKCTDRNVFDFLDTLVTFGFLQREGVLETAKYTDSVNTDFFLDKKKPSYLGGILEMANNRLYQFWGNLDAALMTGEPQNEIKNGAKHPFEELYKSPEKLNEFVNAMGGIQMGNFNTFAQKFDFSNYKSLTDVGGAGAMLSIMVAKHQPKINCTSFDLAPVEQVAKANIKHFNLQEKVKTVSGNFFENELPKSDVITMGNILHDWDEEKKLELMKKAFDALPENGAFVTIENVIDDNRNKNAFGLMMSLNMLIETGHGFDYTFSDFNKWATKTGFRKTALLPLAGPSSACVAYK